MTDKLIGCVQHDCEKCKERESSCNEAYRLAQLRFERIAELEAELAAMESLLGAALGALRYHTEQTRPIQRTYETITMIEASVASLASGAAPSTRLTLLAERDGLEIRAKKAEAELALRIAEIDSLQIDKGHMRAEVERLTALEEATRKANLDCMDHYNEARAEIERLKAQLGEWQGLAGIQGDMIKTIASGAAPSTRLTLLAERDGLEIRAKKAEAELARLKAQPREALALGREIFKQSCSHTLEAIEWFCAELESQHTLASGAAPKETDRG